MVIEIEIEIGDSLAVVRPNQSMVGVVGNENENGVDGENWSRIDDCFESGSEIGEYRAL